MPNNAPTDQREFEGKTIEEATESACKYFALPVEELDIEIINKGSSGIFGLGGRKAKIKVTPKCPAPKIPQKSPKKTAEETPYKKSKVEPGSEISRPKNMQSIPAPAIHTSGKPSDKTPEKQPIESPESPVATQSEEATSMESPRNTLSPPNAAHMDAAREITENLLKKMGLECTVELKNKESGARIEITGQDTAIAIGHKGKTLEAIEYLVNKAVKKRFEAEEMLTTAILVDAGGFRSNREDFLIKLAHSKAEQAKKTGRPVALTPMNPAERRFIHLILKDAEGIRTTSTGTGTMRKVVIIPAKRLPRGPNRPSNHRPNPTSNPKPESQSE
ncbi:MAG: RNA-binding cell elongation regulator Jag/EloR [Dissulfurimicrobium sp.]|uniref:RNA-binding cell elongation regulator Jag/EloR n=1 Tax=Dissulfurimicrobium sp. TaxID=2022436 RepID=UPI00404AF625